MKNYIKIGGIGLIAALGLGFYLYNKPHQNMHNAKAAVQMEAKDLFDAFDSNETEANVKYLDKIIEVSGTIKELSKNESGNLNVTLESGSEMFGVVCEFDSFSEHKKTNFKTGDKITIKGICSGMLMDVVLVRCVVIS